MPWATLMAAGAAVCAANPYFLGWWATIGAGQLAQFAPKTAGEYLSFYLGHEASDLAWYSLVGVILVTGRAFLSPGVYHGMILVCGALIAVLGTAFVWSGIASLRGRVPAEGPDPGSVSDC
jgi:threonine/homoserine/homoserine lactone efflux protein